MTVPIPSHFVSPWENLMRTEHESNVNALALLLLLSVENTHTDVNGCIVRFTGAHRSLLLHYSSSLCFIISPVGWRFVVFFFKDEGVELRDHTFPIIVRSTTDPQSHELGGERPKNASPHLQNSESFLHIQAEIQINRANTKIGIVNVRIWLSSASLVARKTFCNISLWCATQHLESQLSVWFQVEFQHYMYRGMSCPTVFFKQITVFLYLITMRPLSLICGQF